MIECQLSIEFELIYGVAFGQVCQVWLDSFDILLILKMAAFPSLFVFQFHHPFHIFQYAINRS